MLNGSRPARFGLLLLLTFGPLAMVGCGDDLVDESYGFLDLSPYFYDGATSDNPNAGIIRDLRPQRGWLGGKRAEYYDFGLISAQNGRISGKPEFVKVPAIYFFYDQSGRALFSKPIYEEKTGLWQMRGGKAMLDPTPRPNAARNLPYSIRVRRTLVDADRKSSDYQRPIIDFTNADGGTYSGIWEIYEVIAPAGYQPDDIKYLKTLQKGVDDGKFKIYRTQATINCPLVDDRTWVMPSAMQQTPVNGALDGDRSGVSRDVTIPSPKPRMEVWYKTKLGSCYLADGWQALGYTEPFDPPYMSKSIEAHLKLWRASKIKDGYDSRRLDTFDVLRTTTRAATLSTTSVVAQVGRAYVPTVTVQNQNPTVPTFDLRYGNDTITTDLPRVAPNSKPGYRPIRWYGDIKVSQSPPYEAGSFKALEDVDPAQLADRGTTARNLPLIGVAIPCDGTNRFDGACTSQGLECNATPDVDTAVGDAADVDKAALQLKREGGPRCDFPAVGFGEYCTPGVARCAIFPQSQGEIDAQKALGTLGGYSCHPSPTGYCYLRCDSSLANNDAQKNAEVDTFIQDPKNPKAKPVLYDKPKKAVLNNDSRCGGNMGAPGYSCTSPGVGYNAAPVPNRMRVCLKTCSTSWPNTVQSQLCDTKNAMVWNKALGPDAITLTGMSCLNRPIGPQGGGGQSACIWDPSYEPRDPANVPPKP